MKFQERTRVSMEASNHLGSWFITYQGDVQPTYIGVIINPFPKYHGHPSGHQTCPYDHC